MSQMLSTFCVVAERGNEHSFIVPLLLPVVGVGVELLVTADLCTHLLLATQMFIFRS